MSTRRVALLEEECIVWNNVAALIMRKNNCANTMYHNNKTSTGKEAGVRKVYTPSEKLAQVLRDLTARAQAMIDANS